MNNLFSYLFELNVALAILFAAYKLFFEKDKNFGATGQYRKSDLPVGTDRGRWDHPPF